jgi:hypothetical protein
MVAGYVEAERGASPAQRWQVFERLLSSPLLPSDLAVPAK